MEYLLLVRSFSLTAGDFDRDLHNFKSICFCPCQSFLINCAHLRKLSGVAPDITDKAVVIGPNKDDDVDGLVLSAAPSLWKLDAEPLGVNAGDSVRPVGADVSLAARRRCSAAR
uniref:Uncharacterized protein n=1 Tax=Romanomermis culicivorax TaxID=13658 RepID=A0A915KM89_ROMCU